MHPDEAAATVRRKARLAAAAVLLAAGVVMGSGQAQAGGRSAAPSVDAPDRIYHNYCSVCHGEKGDGKSLARYVLVPPPADFTSAQTRRELTRVHMIEVLNKGARTQEGKPTAMVAWKSQLNRQHIEAVVDYVIVRFMDGKVAPNEAAHADDGKHKHHDHSAANVRKVDYPYGLKPSVARGKPLYAANCAGCHGDKGDGQGDPARIGAGHPRNFHDADFREFASGFTLYSAVSRGSGHMPAWEKTLGRAEIADVSEYVLRTFVRSRGTPPAAK